MENELCPERSGPCLQLLVGVGGRLHPWDALAKSVFVYLGLGPHGRVYASVSFLGGAWLPLEGPETEVSHGFVTEPQ